MAMDNGDRAVDAAKAAAAAAMEDNGMSASEASDAADGMESTILRPIIEAIIAEIKGNAATSVDDEAIH